MTQVIEKTDADIANLRKESEEIEKKVVDFQSDLEKHLVSNLIRCNLSSNIAQKQKFKCFIFIQGLNEIKKFRLIITKHTTLNALIFIESKISRIQCPGVN